MTSPLVRVARSEDDFQIGELLVQSFVETYAEKMPHVVVHDERKRDLRDVEMKRKLGTVLVVELEGKIVGTVTLFAPDSPRTEAWLPRSADLRQLAILRGYQRRGLSGALLDRAEAIARDDWKCERICLHVRRGATGVAQLYLSRGFERRPDGDQDLPTIYLEGYALEL